VHHALDISNRIDATEASDVPPISKLSPLRDQPADVGVIAPAGGRADSPAQLRKLA
jgi:hypothetical protein